MVHAESVAATLLMVGHVGGRIAGELLREDGARRRNKAARRQAELREKCARGSFSSASVSSAGSSSAAAAAAVEDRIRMMKAINARAAESHASSNELTPTAASSRAPRSVSFA
eukprot:TRINITY_DN13673_c0_g1_i1.p3 TRINITY_DN13673_c0_g1~~TRINITY_DN13673_c0_g1_i1.p3  ORF type:complete len:113 (+),score=33.70 TRINITY_DN13673_c0_g1_i1:176-514(+)